MRDGVDTFDEISCAYGALGRFQLKETMNIIKGMRQKIQEITDHFYERNIAQTVSEDQSNENQQSAGSFDTPTNNLGTPMKSDISKDSLRNSSNIKQVNTLEDPGFKELTIHYATSPENNQNKYTESSGKKFNEFYIDDQNFDFDDVHF